MTMSTHPPAASTFTSSPLRNRLRVELHAPVAEVWELLGDLARFPEYSAGLDRVEATLDAAGRCTAYVCHFKPLAAGEAPIVAREIIRWWEPRVGYASSGDGDAFGLSHDLHRVIIEPSNEGAVVTWEEFFDAEDLPMMKAHFDEALVDTGENLIRRFGGSIVERYVEQ
jgi:carbon monoxide dehydrogenase subunit G